jgi:hypothetical protein
MTERRTLRVHSGAFPQHLETPSQSILKSSDLTGRTALITGSSAGIGHAPARGLAGARAHVIGGRSPIFNADELAGYGIVPYANAALQGVVAGMQKALTVLRDEKQVQESSGLVTPFAERQRLVCKPPWDALEKQYAM